MVLLSSARNKLIQIVLLHLTLTLRCEKILGDKTPTFDIANIKENCINSNSLTETEELLIQCADDTNINLIQVWDDQSSLIFVLQGSSGRTLL